MTLKMRLTKLEARATAQRASGLLFVHEGEDGAAREDVLVPATGAIVPVDQFAARYPAGTVVKIYEGIDPREI